MAIVWGVPNFRVFTVQEIEASYLAYTYILGRPTETSEPYQMMTYISWFTALRKKKFSFCA